MDFLEIEGNVTAEQSAQLGEAIWHHLPGLRPLREDQFGEYMDRNDARHSHPLALTQLLLTYHLLRQHTSTSQRYAAPVAALSRMGTASAPAGPAGSPPLTWSLTVLMPWPPPARAGPWASAGNRRRARAPRARRGSA